jgi:hypothetical protein
LKRTTFPKSTTSEQELVRIKESKPSDKNVAERMIEVAKKEMSYPFYSLTSHP